MIAYADAFFSGEESDAPPPVPSVWRCFSMLTLSRTSNGYGLNPISYSEIAAWCALFHERLTEWDMNLLRHLDLSFMRHAHEQMNTPKSTEPAVLISAFRDAARMDKGTK